VHRSSSTEDRTCHLQLNRQKVLPEGAEDCQAVLYRGLIASISFQAGLFKKFAQVAETLITLYGSGDRAIRGNHDVSRE